MDYVTISQSEMRDLQKAVALLVRLSDARIHPAATKSGEHAKVIDRAVEIVDRDF